ncbi:hypothetical protein BJ508DRAFT_336339 [Ascobolus immersus RN42]|uniref:Uncharacterized protein n=1 Tax=Ascobolus immersus RN42 TaxID=1160509 RepID=A0A3N4HCZ3_ASCIM|nr:hypothetical protein BJ508DRAFT_336339 [Ascobolus immersus RN42]
MSGNSDGEDGYDKGPLAFGETEAPYAGANPQPEGDDQYSTQQSVDTQEQHGSDAQDEDHMDIDESGDLESKQPKPKYLLASVEDTDNEMPPPTEKKSDRRTSSRRKSGTQQPVKSQSGPVGDQQPRPQSQQARASSRASFRSDNDSVRSSKTTQQPPPSTQVQHPPGATHKQKQQRLKRHSEPRSAAQPQPSPVNPASVAHDNHFKADPFQSDQFYISEVRPSDVELKQLFEKLTVVVARDLGLKVVFQLPADSLEILRCSDNAENWKGAVRGMCAQLQPYQRYWSLRIKELIFQSTYSKKLCVKVNDLAQYQMHLLNTFKNYYQFYRTDLDLYADHFLDNTPFGKELKDRFKSIARRRKRNPKLKDDDLFIDFFPFKKSSDLFGTPAKPGMEITKLHAADLLRKSLLCFLLEEGGSEDNITWIDGDIDHILLRIAVSGITFDLCVAIVHKLFTNNGIHIRGHLRGYASKGDEFGELLWNFFTSEPLEFKFEDLFESADEKKRFIERGCFPFPTLAHDSMKYYNDKRPVPGVNKHLLDNLTHPFHHYSEEAFENPPVDKGLNPTGYYGQGSKDHPFTAVDIRPVKAPGACPHDYPAVLQKLIDEDDLKMYAIDPDSQISKRLSRPDREEIFKTFKENFPIEDDTSDINEIADSFMRDPDRAGVVHTFSEPNNSDHLSKTFKILTMPMASHSNELSNLYAKASVYDQVRITAIIIGHQNNALSNLKAKIHETSARLEQQLEAIEKEVAVLKVQDQDVIEARRKVREQKKELAAEQAYAKNLKARAIQSRLQALDIPKKAPVAVSITSGEEDEGSGDGSGSEVGSESSSEVDPAESVLE